MRCAILALAIALSALAADAAAQGIRGELRVAGSWFEYRTVVRDSLPASEVEGEGSMRQLPDGTWVTCVGDQCYWYRPGAIESAAPFVQDLRFTTWGGRGLSARVSLRSRFGSDAFWPRSSERLEALGAYVNFSRDAFQIRGGRQTKSGGLGAHTFDGLALLWKGWRSARLELFGGRSLARVLIQPRDGALLEAADLLAPDDGSWLLGGEGRIRAGSLNASLLYQRELRFDRMDLYSERLAADADWRVGSTALEGSLDLDLAFRRVTEARLRVKQPLSERWFAEAQVRRYRPFFELWTIWGAFSPVGYTGADASVTWTPRRAWTLRAAGRYRNYDDPNAGASYLPVDGDGGRFDVSATWHRGRWTTTGLFGAEGSFGASRNRVDLSTRRAVGQGSVGAFGSWTEQSLEFRFGKARTLGFGLDAELTSGRLTFFGNAALYRHAFERRPAFDDYTQPRARLGATLHFGHEPVARVRPRMAP